MTSAPDGAAEPAVMAALPAAAAMAAAPFPQRLQLADPAHVALAPPADAVAQPVLFGDDLAVELVLVALLLRQHRVAPFFEMGKSALETAGLAAVEPDRAARQSRRETAGRG